MSWTLAILLSIYGGCFVGSIACTAIINCLPLQDNEEKFSKKTWIKISLVSLIPVFNILLFVADVSVIYNEKYWPRFVKHIQELRTASGKTKAFEDNLNLKP